MEKDTWLVLKNTKEFRFLSHIFNNWYILKPIMLLDRTYLTSGEVRLLGITRLNVDLELQDIVERKISETHTMYRLTEFGLEIQTAINKTLEVLRNGFNAGKNISTPPNSPKK